MKEGGGGVLFSDGRSALCGLSLSFQAMVLMALWDSWAALCWRT